MALVITSACLYTTFFIFSIPEALSLMARIA
jgi:hypothetical protein